MDVSDYNAKINDLASDVLRLARNTLLVDLRFLDAALSRLTPLSSGEIALGTEGEHIVYEPRSILKTYRAEREAVTRNYLHLLLHCVYRHMFVHTLVDQAAWDLACDIAVEYTISGLNLRAVSSAREAAQSNVLSELEQKAGKLTAERIYRYYLDQKLPGNKLARLRGLFYADNHKLWYLPPEQQRQLLGLSGENGSSDGNEEGDSGGETASEADGAASVSLKIADYGVSGRASTEADWKGVAERMQMEMEAFAERQQGLAPGGLLQNLREVNRERYDYTSFLKKFAVSGEAMRINDEEFDYVFYTYGLRLYRNLPLIEPLEYKEVKRIREFVIAIDTSGSVSGELVQSFIQKTYNILQSTESFFSKINIHIIQCDAEIQEHVKITKREEFDEYLKTMKIHGLGGTDFRPVFSLVDDLVRQREFTNLKGLIYFTDGYGTFPAQKPDYETAFLFLEDDEYGNPEVPPWAIRLVLKQDEI